MVNAHLLHLHLTTLEAQRYTPYLTNSDILPFPRAGPPPGLAAKTFPLKNTLYQPVGAGAASPRPALAPAPPACGYPFERSVPTSSARTQTCLRVAARPRGPGGRGCACAAEGGGGQHPPSAATPVAAPACQVP